MTPIMAALSMTKNHIPKWANDHRNPVSARIVSEPASPSMPSMRLMAFEMNTTKAMVNKAPIHQGMRWMPKMPYRLFRHSPYKGKADAAKTCTANLFIAFRPTMSSMSPVI